MSTDDKPVGEFPPNWFTAKIDAAVETRDIEQIVAAIAGAMGDPQLINAIDVALVNLDKDPSRRTKGEGWAVAEAIAACITKAP